ncbi:hypothetical protein [Stenotrophomonas humi]
MQIKDAEPTSGRILADMEGLPEKKASHASGSSLLHRYPVGSLAAAAALVIITGVSFWNFSRDSPQIDGAHPTEHLAKTQTLVPTSKPGIKPDAVPAEGAARIVNSPEEASAIPQPKAQLAAAIQPLVETPVATQSTVAAGRLVAKPTAPPATKFARVAPPKAATRAAPSRPKPAARRTATATKATSDETLIVTLMGIINEGDKATSATSPQTIDDLIARIEGNQQQRTQRGSAQTSQRKPASTQSNIQAQLRRCPNPNTLQGVECRSKICAGLDSQDPACPAG